MQFGIQRLEADDKPPSIVSGSVTILPDHTTFDNHFKLRRKVIKETIVQVSARVIIGVAVRTHRDGIEIVWELADAASVPGTGRL